MATDLESIKCKKPLFGDKVKDDIGVIQPSDNNNINAF